MRNFTLYAKLFAAQVICGFVFSQAAKAQTIFYGTTQNGGADSLGAIIAYNVTTGTESVAYSFGRDTDGQNPTGNLVYCPLNQLLYGLTTSGGKYGFGAVISFNPATNAEAVLWSFGRNSSSPAIPYGDLVYDATHQLFYGMTFEGGTNNIGCVFSFNPVTDTAKRLWTFSYGAGASLPYGDMVLNPDNGWYYGMTTQGGNNNDGAIIALDPVTDTVHRVYNFNDGQSGETPNGSLVWSEETHLFYGLTSQGGTDSVGTIFSFNPADSVEITLHNFTADTDAQGPSGNLIYDHASGLFYGLSYTGGTNNEGAIFSFDPATSTERVVYSFASVANDGSSPNGNLIYSPDNQLYYGYTQGGGTHQLGTIFSFNAATGAETTLWSLGAGFDGSQPWGSPLLYKDGMPLGITPVANNYKLNLYPNPGNGNFELQSQNAVGAVYHIYNINGALVASGTIQSDMQQISAGNVTAGIYTLLINTTQNPLPLRFVVVK